MSNPNKNCLEGMRCPKCENYGPFRIEISAVVTMYDEGTEYIPGGDAEWMNGSYCQCLECDHEGTVEHFTEERQKLIEGLLP